MRSPPPRRGRARERPLRVCGALHRALSPRRAGSSRWTRPWPCAFTSAPLELPELIAASVWIRSLIVPLPVSNERPTAETMPRVTVGAPARSSALPIATTSSPTCTVVELPTSAVVSPSTPRTRSSATSAAVSIPTTCALRASPPAAVTWTSATMASAAVHPPAPAPAPSLRAARAAPAGRVQRPFEPHPERATLEVESTMYRRVLLAVDARRVADAAVAAVVRLTAASGGEVLVVHVRDIERGLRTRFEDQRLVDHVVGRLHRAGVAARGEVRTISDGDVAGVLADSARRFGADVIAMGSHGRSELGGLLLGTVGHQVASRTDRAVVLVRGEPTGPSRRWPARIERILLAVDRSEQREHAVRAALGLGRQHGAEVVVQYVDPVLESPSSARRFVSGIVDRLRSEGVRARGAALAGMGAVAFQIATEAERVDADLIVVGSRRRGDLAALVLGSVTRDLVRRTTRPVLLAGTSESPERDAGVAAAPARA